MWSVTVLCFVVPLTGATGVSRDFYWGFCRGHVFHSVGRNGYFGFGAPYVVSLHNVRCWRFVPSAVGVICSRSGKLVYFFCFYLPRRRLSFVAFRGTGSKFWTPYSLTLIMLRLTPSRVIAIWINPTRVGENGGECIPILHFLVLLVPGLWAAEVRRHAVTGARGDVQWRGHYL